ncbi:MAG TPA: chloride channel protein [Candidatus Angelobacter sp.]|nr:chloride channel protein [Candidatus Angelobacter sp.]
MGVHHEIQQVSEGESKRSKKWYLPSPMFHIRLTQTIHESLVVLFYALLVGVVAGYGAVGFRKLIDLFQFTFFDVGKGSLHSLGRFDVWLLPAIGLLLVSLLVRFFAPEAKGHGVPEVMAAIAEKGGIIRPRIVLVKAVASALTIGSGGSVGREGPIVQIGSAFGSALGQYLGLPSRLLRLLVACGAGAGIAATFNAPIGGVMFATEVILGSFVLQNFTAIVISSVVSAAIGRIYLGNTPAFPMPLYEVGHFSVYWVYVVVGVFAGLWSVIYIKTLYRIEDWFDARKWSFWVKALFGGAVVGLIGIGFPEVFGVGYSSVDAALMHHLGLWLLIALLVLKLFATSVTIAAGGSGGVFSPGLYMGSMLGGAIGVLLSFIFPHFGLSPGALAMMGMAGVFAGSSQAPVTAIMMLFEMTGDYNIILPLMITSVLSATITSLLSKETIYTLKLSRRGLDITRTRQADRMKAIYVGEAIAVERLTVSANQTIAQAWEAFSQTKDWFALVRNRKGELLGSVARAQVLEALTTHHEEDLLESLLPQNIYRIDERATLAKALHQMNQLGVTYLLVCRKDEPIGVIGSSDIIHSYESKD